MIGGACQGRGGAHGGRSGDRTPDGCETAASHRVKTRPVPTLVGPSTGAVMTRKSITQVKICRMEGSVRGADRAPDGVACNRSPRWADRGILNGIGTEVVGGIGGPAGLGNGRRQGWTGMANLCSASSSSYRPHSPTVWLTVRLHLRIYVASARARLEPHRGPQNRVVKTDGS